MSLLHDLGDRELRAPLIALLPYQRAWVADRARFKAGMMARQTGKTFASSVEVVVECIDAMIAGRRSRWVILSRGERQARECMLQTVQPITKAFFALYRGQLGGTARPHYGERLFKGAEAEYKALEITFPGGSRITGLPANPDTARGFSANVLLDEFAFHRDSRAIWAALFPVISRSGLKLRVVSTPNGKGNRFHEIMTGRDGLWSRHVTDIHQAVAQGLDRDVAALRQAIGDPDAWAREFELKWLDEASAWLSHELIAAVEQPEAGRPELYGGGLCYIGNDIARGSDLWCAWVLEAAGDLLITREVVVLRRASFAEQDAVLDALMARYRVARLAMDQTGIGEKPVEDAGRRYGRYRVEGVIFTAAQKQDLATVAKHAFETRRLRIPAGDAVLRADLHKIRKSVGPTGIPRFSAERDSRGHADRAWALFLALRAARAPHQSYAYEPLGRTWGPGRGGSGRGEDQGEDREEAARGFRARRGLF